MFYYQLKKKTGVEFQVMSDHLIKPSASVVPYIFKALQKNFTSA